MLRDQHGYGKNQEWVADLLARSQVPRIHRLPRVLERESKQAGAQARASVNPVARELRTPERVVWAVKQLAVAPADDILEVGCGPGHAVALVCPGLVRGTVTAIDRSELQVEKARALNRRFMEQGRARIEVTTLSDAPAALARRFSKVFAINVNAFWTEPESISTLRELLRPGGRVYLVYEPPSAAGSRKLRASVPELLSSRGFAVEDIRTSSARSRVMLCVVASRSKGA
jgi:protein-L-isoaspartate O-methyltransferase